jgi:hypothetical protein
VYHIRIQRNSRIHNEEVKPEEQIIKAIRRGVKAKMDFVKALLLFYIVLFVISGISSSD